MNEILPFSFQNVKIRTVLINGEPWFVAKDISVVLEIKNNRQFLVDLEEDERGSFKMTTSGGEQELTIVSESGLYALIMRSRKSVAKPFQRWISREVLPEIRKTGSYSLQKTEKLDFEEIQKTLNFGEKVLETLKSKNVFEKIKLDNLVKTQNGISILETLKINFDNLLFLPTELGKFLGISPMEMNQNFKEKGLQIKTDGVWKLTEKGQKFGVDVSETFPQIKWKIEVLFL
ncbi:prophage antirepressor [Thiovulum sp. ES]|nr:prophage antirepressor [Thiovulum sp. ES]